MLRIPTKGVKFDFSLPIADRHPNPPGMPYLRLFLLGLLVGAATLHAQIVDDVTVSYAYMDISQARLNGEVPGGPSGNIDLADLDLDVDFARQFFDITFGRGPYTFGATFQRTLGTLPFGLAAAENGLMLTAGYDHILSPLWRVESFARVGVLGSSDNQALYAEDTDLRVNAVRYWPDGKWIIGDRPVYPSVYVGGIVNKYGRVQGIAGVGAWWKGVGVYATGYHAFNGVDDPLTEFFGGTDKADYQFAALSNTGVSGTLRGEWGPVTLSLRRNLGLRNAGNDLTVTASYRLAFRRDEVIL